MRKDKSFRGTGCARKMRKNHRSISVQGGEGAFRGVKTAFYSTISAILLNKTGEKTALRTVCRVASGYFGDFRAYFRNNVFASLPSRSQHLAVRWLACRCFALVALAACPTRPTCPAHSALPPACVCPTPIPLKMSGKQAHLTWRKQKIAHELVVWLRSYAICARGTRIPSPAKQLRRCL